MSLLGIDVGTTGCKTAVFAADGKILTSAYEEYDIQTPQGGWAVLDAFEVWEKVKRAISRVACSNSGDPIDTLSVSSLGEALVPVTNDRQILAPSILFFDARGQEYIDDLKSRLDDKALYHINGNTWGNQYSATKLMWIKDNQPELYKKADKFLLWGSLIGFMLGSEAAVDYSLANRTLLFDLNEQHWSDTLLSLTGIEGSKLARLVPSGTVVGKVSNKMAKELGLTDDVAIITGAHDQCANALGCGAIDPGQAMYGMGTFLCATPIFNQRPNADQMANFGLNTEHHAIGERFVSFIYNQGGCLVKWFRDTFAAEDYRIARQKNLDIYDILFAEIPEVTSKVVVLPHFTACGPPKFLTNSCGFMAGLKLDTTRADILKGILEGATFYLLQSIDNLSKAGFDIFEYRAVGGGSKSDRWLQLSADILGQPFTRPDVSEAGTLGAAIIAGMGRGVFNSLKEGVSQMVRPERIFEPDRQRHEQYAEQYIRYTRLEHMAEQYLAFR